LKDKPWNIKILRCLFEQIHELSSFKPEVVQGSARARLREGFYSVALEAEQIICLAEEWEIAFSGLSKWEVQEHVTMPRWTSVVGWACFNLLPRAFELPLSNGPHLVIWIFEKHSEPKLSQGEIFKNQSSLIYLVKKLNSL
jgi:hypothetical protein